MLQTCCESGVTTALVYQCWGAGVVICLERGADLHVAQLMLLPLTVSWSGFLLPFVCFLVSTVCDVSEYLMLLLVA